MQMWVEACWHINTSILFRGKWLTRTLTYHHVPTVKAVSVAVFVEAL